MKKRPLAGAGEACAATRAWGSSSEGSGRKSVAGLDAAGTQAGAEPALALGAGAVREAVRHHGAAACALQGVVADLGCRIHGRLHIALLQDLAGALPAGRPDAGQAIGRSEEHTAELQ